MKRALPFVMLLTAAMLASFVAAQEAPSTKAAHKAGPKSMSQKAP